MGAAEMMESFGRRLAAVRAAVPGIRARLVALTGIAPDDPFWRRNWPGLLAGLGVLASILAILIAVPLDGVAGEWQSRALIWRSLTRLGQSDWLLVPSGVAALFLGGYAYAHRVAVGRDVAASLERAAFFFATIAVTGLASSLLKNCLGWPRPAYDHLPARPFAFDAAFASFPSGHATTAAAFAVTVAILWPRLRWPAALLALGIGLSRIMLHAHHLSDVVAGFAFGGWGTLAIAWVFARKGWGFDFDAAGWPRLRRHDTATLFADIAAAARFSLKMAGRGLLLAGRRLAGRGQR